eukprot:2885716-Rhodomonas_salina.2
MRVGAPRRQDMHGRDGAQPAETTTRWADTALHPEQTRPWTPVPPNSDPYLVDVIDAHERLDVDSDLAEKEVRRNVVGRGSDPSDGRRRELGDPARGGLALVKEDCVLELLVGVVVGRAALGPARHAPRLLHVQLHLHRLALPLHRVLRRRVERHLLELVDRVVVRERRFARHVQRKRVRVVRVRARHAVTVLEVRLHGIVVALPQVELHRTQAQRLLRHTAPESALSSSSSSSSSSPS